MWESPIITEGIPLRMLMLCTYLIDRCLRYLIFSDEKKVWLFTDKHTRIITLRKKKKTMRESTPKM